MNVRRSVLLATGVATLSLSAVVPADAATFGSVGRATLDGRGVVEVPLTYTCVDATSDAHSKVRLTQENNSGYAQARLGCTGKPQTVTFAIVGSEEFKAGSVDYEVYLQECFVTGCHPEERPTGTLQLGKK